MTTQAESLRAAAQRVLSSKRHMEYTRFGEFEPCPCEACAALRLALAATPPAEGLERRLSDCEDALATVEAAYDEVATPPTEGLDARLRCDFDCRLCAKEDDNPAIPRQFQNAAESPTENP